MLNFSHIKGDTFEEVPFQINYNSLPLDIKGSSIKMQLRLECGGVPFLTLATGSGLTFGDETNGEFSIDKQIINIDENKYLYDIEITFANGDVKTWVSGEFNIICDITR